MNWKKLTSFMLLVVAALVLTGCGAGNNSTLVQNTGWVGSDNSLIEYSGDGTFKFYRSKTDTSDGFYSGGYECKTGKAAVNHITKNLKDYGVTQDDLKTLFRSNPDYSEDNFVCIVLNNEQCIVGGINILDKPIVTPYYGFHFDEMQFLNLLNMNTNNYHYYTKNQ